MNRIIKGQFYISWSFSYNSFVKLHGAKMAVAIDSRLSGAI